MAKISAVISAYNEEKNIERCLKSLSFVDEIVVVDNSSTDNTAKIAKKYTNKLFTQENNPLEVDIQKNFGFEKATSDWILYLDADEEISKPLKEEIGEVIKKRTIVTGYWIPRQNYIFGKWIEHSGWYPDYQLRLFKRGKGKYINTHVHEPISIEGETGHLRHNIIHHNYETIEQFLKKTVTLYAPNEAEERIKAGYEFSFFDAIRFPLNEFLSRFFARKGYKDGYHGLMLALLMSTYHFIVFAFIWEKGGFKQYDKENFLDDTEKEIRSAGKDILYWLAKEKIGSMKNPLKRGIRKITKKIYNI
ncbi:MAG: glycosyltransferase family 2 protein [Actinobacteria bacterium]|nr:glycosyltransferase family 2 protein [Actinomycetota bacterium]